MNLLLNSIDAVLDGGLIRVILAANEEDRFVEVQNKIFNPFYSTKMNQKNAVLGLSICRHIAEAHSGIITFSSTPGMLTAFKIKFPLR